jgi:transcriptional regulator with XRE-family HTH domain
VANPQVVRAAWIELGHQLAAKRKAANLSQQELAKRTTYSRSSIASIEIGLQHVDQSFWEKADQLLDAGGELVRGYDAAEALQRHHQRPAGAVSATRRIPGPTEDLPGAGALFIDPARMSVQPTAGGPAEQANSFAKQGGSTVGLDHYLWVPPGRALPGVVIPAQVHRAVRDDQVVAQVPAAYVQHPFIQRPGRALVIGQLDESGAEAYVLDSRHARRRLRDAGDNARLLIPPAYRLDELTFALL